MTATIVDFTRHYQLASRQHRAENTLVFLGPDCVVGGNNLVIIAGPCAVESETQIIATARAVKKAGAHALRGGAFKPRTSAYSFQGLGEEGLRLLRRAGDETGLPVVTEILDHSLLELYMQYADVLQIGARNMQNFPLLRAVGRCKKPVLLKRGMMSSIDEFLMSAEYILAEGNPNVILCERGIRTFETSTRNTLDLNAIPVITARTHLPVLVDPSHGTGVRDYVAPMSKAAVACGCHGLMIEVHMNPEFALSDGQQSLEPGVFASLVQELEPLARVCGRTLAKPADLNQVVSA